jgi:HPt (histidine-containing phosphotransfer) domain-containing protein
VSTPQQEFQKFLDQQRVDYRRSLPEKAAQIQALWTAAEAGGAGASPLADLERLVHSLAGTAGTLGFRELGQAAKLLEMVLAEVAEANGPVASLTPAQRPDIARAVAALQASFPGD